MTNSQNVRFHSYVISTYSVDELIGGDGAADGNRTRMIFLPRDFKSLASACSATAANVCSLSYCQPSFRFVSHLTGTDDRTRCTGDLGGLPPPWCTIGDLNSRPYD